MNILRAEHLGMCFGVRQAIALAVSRAQQEPITVLGELVHNETVLHSLQGLGIQTVNQPEAIATPTVLITAHGASEQMKRHLEDRRLKVLEATCPLVRLVHRSVRELLQSGYHPVVVGKRSHAEVCGVIEDLEDFDVILTEADVAAMKSRLRYGIVAQTTQPIEHVRRLVSLVRERFPQAEVRFIDTVCQPTKQRQSAAMELAQHAELVLVVGSEVSNNTQELVRTCSRYCARVHQVSGADDLSPLWLEGVQTVGITAGTSTPDAVVEAVELRLREMEAAVRPAKERPLVAASA